MRQLPRLQQTTRICLVMRLQFKVVTVSVLCIVPGIQCYRRLAICAILQESAYHNSDMLLAVRCARSASTAQNSLSEAHTVATRNLSLDKPQTNRRRQTADGAGRCCTKAVCDAECSRECRHFARSGFARQTGRLTHFPPQMNGVHLLQNFN